MTIMEIKKMKKQFSEINSKEVITAVFPFSKHLEIVHEAYVPKGIAEWPTWLILIKNKYNVLHQYEILTICGHSSYTHIKNIENLDLENYIEEMKVKSESIDNFDFSWWHQNIGKQGFMTINEANRLYDYLKGKGIKLFEPTE